MSDAINRGTLSFEIQDVAKTYEQQPYRQIGDDTTHVDLYGEIEAELRANAPETLTDSNCIFIDGINGDDSTGSGAEASPYKTVSKGVEIFFAQASRVKKYLCLKGYSYFCEDVQIPRWLEDYIYCESSTATAIGNVDLSGGHNWSAVNKTFIIYTTDSGTDTTITLNANCADQAAVISHINTQLSGAGISEVEAYDAGSNYIGFHYTTSGSYVFRLTSENIFNSVLVTLGTPAGYYEGLEKIKIRKVERSIPVGLSDSNTKWVFNYPDYQTYQSGVENNPYQDILVALNDISTSAFLYVAIKVSPQYPIYERRVIWQNEHSLTHTVHLFTYYSNTGHDISTGFSYEHHTSFSGASYLNEMQNYTKYQYIVSRNFNSDNKEEIIFCNFNSNTYAVEKAPDFTGSNWTTIASTSTRNWTGICEYYYNGYWYLLVCGDDGGSAMRIFHYRSDGSDTGEITVSLDNTASTTKRHYFMSDGNNAFMVCYDSSKSYIFLAKNNTDITVNSNWAKLYEGTDNIRLFNTPGDEFYWVEDGKTNIYKYDGDGSYNEYDFGLYVSLIFKYNDEYYFARKNINSIVTIYKILSFSEVIYTPVLSTTVEDATLTAEDLEYISYFNNDIYLLSPFNFYLFSNSQLIKFPHYIVDFDLEFYQFPIFKSFIIRLCTDDIFIKHCLANYVSFGKLIINGIYFPSIYSSNAITGDCISSEYCSFNSYYNAIDCKEEMLDDITNCAFIDCDHPITVERYGGYDVEYCLFDNYITAVHYQCDSGASNYKIELNNCTGYGGTTFFEEDARSVNTNYQSEVNECVIAKTSVGIKSYADEAVLVTNTMFYPYLTNLNAEIDDDSLFSIPLFRDTDNDDFRLKTISAGYQYNSAGYQASDTTDTATGKDYNWNAYTAQNIDLGAMVVLDPVYRTEQWETITLDYSPQSFQIDYVQQDTAINRTLQNKAYKVIPKIYRQFTYQFRSDNNFDLKNIQRIKRLMGQTTKFKLFMNPLLDYDPSECSNGTVGWQSGNWTIASMIISTGITMEAGQYDNLFVRIHDSGSVYEYRIIDTDASGNLTIEDYWEIGDMSDGTYNTEISYALVFYDTSTLQNKNQVYGGINYNDSVPLAGQTLKFIEAI